MYPLILGHSTGMLLWGLALLLGIGGGAALAARDGHGLRRSLAALVGCAAILLAGAKVHFWLANWALVRADGIGAYLDRGFHLPGGILAVVLVGPWVLLFLRLHPFAFGDSVVPAAALGIAAVRLGCFANGCCVGGVSAAPWAVAFPHGARVYYSQLGAGIIPPSAAVSLPVLPLSLFFAVTALLSAATLLAWRRRRRFAGQLTLAALVLWATTTATLEWWRDETTVAGAPHLFEIAALAAGAVVPLLAVLTYRHRHEEAPLG